MPMRLPLHRCASLRPRARGQPEQLALGLRVQEKEWTRLRAYLQCAVTDRQRTEQDIEELEPKLAHLRARAAAAAAAAANVSPRSSATGGAAGGEAAEGEAGLAVKAQMLEAIVASKRQVLEVKLRLEEKIRLRLTKEEQVRCAVLGGGGKGGGVWGRAAWRLVR
jgi:hypothetical protein